MTELPPEAAALIEQARKAHGPRQADRDRVLTGLHASLGIGAASALAAASASATASAAESAALTHAASTGKAVLGWKSALLTWKAGKVMLTTVALGGAIGVGAATRGPQPADHGTQRTVRAPVSAPARPAAVAERRMVEVAAPNAPAPEPPAYDEAAAVSAPSAEPRTRLQPAQPGAAEPKRVVEPAEVAHGSAAESRVEPLLRAKAGSKSARSARHHGAEPRTSEHGSTRNEGPPASATVAAAVEEATSPVATSTSAPSEQAPLPAGPKAESELVLIRRALTSLRDHDSEQALTVLAEHATRYPSGAFATERRGLRIVALCAAGLVDQGQREQAAFLQEAGSSPIATRVRRACSENGQ